MDPSAVLFLTGFPVNILDQGFVSSLFNPQGTSLAASMAPLCAAMLNMRLWGLKAVNLDILPTPHKWNQCTEEDPWSADDYKVMGEMAALIEKADFQAIFSMGHLATDTLRQLPAAKNVGGNYGLEKDSYAFEIGSGGTTLVFSGCHPQVRPPPFRSSPPQPPPLTLASLACAQNLLKTWTGNAVAFAGDWDDTLHRIMHYTGGNKNADTCTMKQFVEHSKAFAWTETALHLAIAVRGRELNKVRRAIPFDDLPPGLKQALKTENIMSHADCAAHTLYKEGAGGKFPSAAALLLKIYNKRGTDNRVALLTQVERVPGIELKGMSASASFLASFNSAFFQDIVDAAAALTLTSDAKTAFNKTVAAGLTVSPPPCSPPPYALPLTTSSLRFTEGRQGERQDDQPPPPAPLLTLFR